MTTDNIGRYANLTVVAALVTFGIKLWAAIITGSVGLLSDAMESVINLVSSALLVVILRIAKSPPDPDHPFGHDKAEYFANGAQGTLILLAALGIGSAAAERFMNPFKLEAGPLGVGLALLASVINFAVARLIQAKGESLRSEALKGEAAHLMSDVWTSVAVVAGVGMVYLTDIPWLDPLAALAICGWIIYTGAQLISASIHGLMDRSMPDDMRRSIVKVLDRYKADSGIDYHALRSRTAGARTFVSVHVLVPGAWSVKKGHELMHEIEAEVCAQLEGVSLFTHLEPLEEQCSFDDMEIA